MSLRVDARATYYPSVLEAIIFDDFFADLYDSRIWALSGTGGVIAQSLNGGVIRVRGNTGTDATFWMNNIGGHSVAVNFEVEWRGRMLPSAGGSVECGVQGIASIHWMCWRYEAGTTNFQCQSAAAATTTVDSGVVADSAYHLFRIVGSPGVIQFFLDGISRAVITTNITTELLQPYVWSQGGSTTTDFFADYCLMTGDRA